MVYADTHLAMATSLQCSDTEGASSAMCSMTDAGNMLTSLLLCVQPSYQKQSLGGGGGKHLMDPLFLL